MAFSPDGRMLGSGSNEVRIWELSTGRCWKVLGEGIARVHAIAFSPDGQTLASGSQDQTIKLWNVRSGKCKKTLRGHNNGVRSVSFSPNGLTLASSSEDETIRIWDITSFNCLKILNPQLPYDEMNITDVIGLTEAQKTSLKALGAVENAYYTE